MVFIIQIFPWLEDFFTERFCIRAPFGIAVVVFFDDDDASTDITSRFERLIIFVDDFEVMAFVCVIAFHTPVDPYKRPCDFTCQYVAPCAGSGSGTGSPASIRVCMV